MHDEDASRERLPKVSSEPPLDEEKLEKMRGRVKRVKFRGRVRRALMDVGIGGCEAHAGDRPQFFDTRMIQGLLKAFEDLDHYFC